ncbi:DUF4340 domain-containing protein [Elioraea tepida]|jgi:hypothetical protein|uniref:DUF4340 domain-containing protein n=1 Tax=Elioraea tepida TaxID=2843330 RepID=A0A975YJB0_9PROT|nr:DUF4340 domain-containing protein [Elioraea tepida]QXM24247.1 DUF4340 domain-containing protein [Elioraea tepida]
MTRRGVLLLGAAALAAAGGAAAVLLGGERPRTEALVIGEPAFPGVAPRLAEAVRIEIRRHDGTLVLTRADGVWGLADKGGYPVRPDRVRELFAGLVELKLIEERTGNPELFSRLGLEDVTVPGGTSQLLRVLDAQGNAIVEAILGRRRIRTAGNLPEAIYLRRPGETRTFLAEGTLRTDNDPMLWVEREILDIRRSRIASATTHRAGAEPVRAVRRSADLESVELEGMAEDFRADQAKVDDLPRALEWLTFNDVRPAASLAGATTLGEARFETFDGLGITVRLVGAEEKRWALFAVAWQERPRPDNPPNEVKSAEEAKAEAEALSRRLSPWAFQLIDWKADVLLYRPEDVAAPPARDPS